MNTDNDQLDAQDFKKWGGAGPAPLENSVLLTLLGVGFMTIGLPLTAFGGTVMIFGAILSVTGIAALGFGLIRGGWFLLVGYIRDFKAHWRRAYIKPAIAGAAAGLFFSLLFPPSAPILMLVGAAAVVHFARKIRGDTALPRFPAPADSGQPPP